MVVMPMPLATTPQEVSAARVRRDFLAMGKHAMTSMNVMNHRQCAPQAQCVKILLAATNVLVKMVSMETDSLARTSTSV